MKSPIAAFAALALLAGCVSAGTKVTEAQASQFEKGKSTEADVIGKLGQPNSSTRLGDGSRMDAYVYTAAQARAVSFIPVVGLMAGGADSKMTMVSFKFGADGVLTDWTSTTSGASVNSGLLNQ